MLVTKIESNGRCYDVAVLSIEIKPPVATLALIQDGELRMGTGCIVVPVEKLTFDMRENSKILS